MSISRGVLTSHVSLAFQQGTDFALAYATRRNSLDQVMARKEGVKSHCHHMTGNSHPAMPAMPEGLQGMFWLMAKYWIVGYYWFIGIRRFQPDDAAMGLLSLCCNELLSREVAELELSSKLWPLWSHVLSFFGLRRPKSQNISKQQALHEMEEPPPLLYRVSHDLQDIFELTLGEQLDLIDLIVINPTKQDQWIRKVMPKRTVAPGEKKLGCWMVWHSALQTYGCGWK